MKLYMKYVSILAKSQMQYKTSFILLCIGQFLGAFSAFAALYFMMSRFNKVEGFTFSEVLLCFATVLMAFSLAECFARGFDQFSSMISNGEFDRVMVRPRGLIIQVLGSKLELSRIGRFAQAALTFAISIPQCGVQWTAIKIMVLILMVICGALVFTGLFVIYASLCFFTTEGLEFMNIFTDGGREFGQYPYAIYGRGILKFLTYVVPLALFQYYPFLYLIGRTDSLLYAFAPILSLLFFIPCCVLWQIGLKHYKSTGS